MRGFVRERGQAAREAPPPEAMRHCRDLTRAHSQTFFLGSQLFPAGQRQAVWAVYAACRLGDDIADEGEPALRPAALDAWWASVRAALAGELVDGPVYQALAWAARQHPIPTSAFHELYLGLRMDLEERGYASLDELELYCRRVAGVVGFMIAPICGFEGGEDTLRRALRLGQAMQLTNILRDVGEDLERGRVYLPADLLAEYSVTPGQLRAGWVSPEYVALMRRLSAVARDWYTEGRGGLPRLHGPGRLAVATAARAYEGILDALEAQGFDNFSQRAHVSGPRKLLMVPQAWWELRSL